MLQNCHMLAGKIRKSVYVKHMIFAITAVFQLLQQQRFHIPGIPLALSAQTVIGIQKKRQFLQFLRKTALCLGCRMLQILSCDTAAFELVHRIHQVGQKLRFCFHRCVGF